MPEDSNLGLWNDAKHLHRESQHRQKPGVELKDFRHVRRTIKTSQSNVEWDACCCFHAFAEISEPYLNEVSSDGRPSRSRTGIDPPDVFPCQIAAPAIPKPSMLQMSIY